ncbi:hypothetical protein HDU83_002874 [Entophlyctis luteolus]|nr:hypothetical protein HDU82_006878 [Entophlyctis luteolus]KAJ3346554.1 hypothetical protein HDU83_002874 [Entophlyctis luteolus]
MVRPSSSLRHTDVSRVLQFTHSATRPLPAAAAVDGGTGLDDDLRETSEVLERLANVTAAGAASAVAAASEVADGKKRLSKKSCPAGGDAQIPLTSASGDEQPENPSPDDMLDDDGDISGVRAAAAYVCRSCARKTSMHS